MLDLLSIATGVIPSPEGTRGACERCSWECLTAVHAAKAVDGQTQCSACRCAGSAAAAAWNCGAVACLRDYVYLLWRLVHIWADVDDTLPVTGGLHGKTAAWSSKHQCFRHVSSPDQTAQNPNSPRPWQACSRCPQNVAAAACAHQCALQRHSKDYSGASNSRQS